MLYFLSLWNRLVHSDSKLRDKALFNGRWIDVVLEYNPSINVAAGGVCATKRQKSISAPRSQPLLLDHSYAYARLQEVRCYHLSLFSYLPLFLLCALSIAFSHLIARLVERPLPCHIE